SQKIAVRVVCPVLGVTHRGGAAGFASITIVRVRGGISVRIEYPRRQTITRKYRPAGGTEWICHSVDVPEAITISLPNVTKWVAIVCFGCIGIRVSSNMTINTSANDAISCVVDKRSPISHRIHDERQSVAGVITELSVITAWVPHHREVAASVV